MRLCPIIVSCFHQVSDVYDPLTMWECDWTQTEQFKHNILQLKKNYTFISLSEAHDKLAHDKLRLCNYAVLTADDGYHSLLNVLPWLEEQRIPITLFINTQYLDKNSWSQINEEQARRVNPNVDMYKDVCPNLYLSKKELFEMQSPWVTVGLHGHEHFDAMKMSEMEFRSNVEKCRDVLSSHLRYVPFYAYTWGHHDERTDKILKEMGLIPVLVNGMCNYDNPNYIDRICIDGKLM